MSEIIPSLKSTYHELDVACNQELVFFTGPPGLGKTTLVKKLFENREKEYLHAYIDCYCVMDPTDLLTKICQAFHENLDIRRANSLSNQDLPESGQPVSLSQFEPAVRAYKRIALSKGFKRIFIVLDQIEAFVRTTMMDTFSMLCGYNTESIRLVIISCEGPMDMIHQITSKSPATAASVQDRCMVVLCNQWSVEDIIKWILDTSPDSDEEIYRKFVKSAVSLMVATRTKNPCEIRKLCQDGYEDFVKFYRQQRREIVLRHVGSEAANYSDGELDEYEREGYFNTGLLVTAFLKTFRRTLKMFKTDAKWTSEDTATHVPRNTGVLIVAAYVAAYTKPSDDKLNFIKCQRKKSSSRRKTREPEMISRPFTLERLMQIYLALQKSSLGVKVLSIIYNNDRVLGDVERLTNLGMLKHVSGSVFSSESRYKLSTTIKKEYVIRLALNNEVKIEELQGLADMTLDEGRVSGSQPTQ